MASKRRAWKKWDAASKRTVETDWTQVEAWGKRAEACGRYLHTGRRVWITGSLITRLWDGRETGQKCFKLAVRSILIAVRRCIRVVGRKYETSICKIFCGYVSYCDGELFPYFTKKLYWWAGWASTLRNEPFLTTLFDELKAERRFRVAA